MFVDDRGMIRCGDCVDTAIPCVGCQSLTMLEYRLGDPERIKSVTGGSAWRPYPDLRMPA